jgi:prepilin-type N-terminal cleavage/methylation domain-containing protein
MINMIKFFNQKNKGFTLIETLVAITILVSAVAAPLTLAFRSLVAAQFTKNQIIASYLAQDAIEYVRNIRDENVLRDRAWLSGLGSCGNGCRVDSPNDTVNGCSGPSCLIKKDPSSGLYGHRSQWEDTLFFREVTVTSIDTDEAKISVTINWQQGVIPRTYTLKETIFNWNN